MKNSKVTIRKIDDKLEIIKPAAKKQFFGRRKVFIDPTFKNMKYKRFNTYAENKQDYYNTLSLVFTGKCKDIFEAYKLNHSC